MLSISKITGVKSSHLFSIDVFRCAKRSSRTLVLMKMTRIIMYDINFKTRNKEFCPASSTVCSMCVGSTFPPTSVCIARPSRARQAAGFRLYSTSVQLMPRFSVKFRKHYTQFTARTGKPRPLLHIFYVFKLTKTNHQRVILTKHFLVVNL